jgi:hypothetical protein
MARSRVELFEQIRRDRRVGRLSVRELAENRHVHRRAVRQALASAVRRRVRRMRGGRRRSMRTWR